MTTRLISDLHLHPGAPEVTEGFLRWLEQLASDTDTLYILGDFFDAWIGDDLLDLVDSDPTGSAALAVRVADALQRLSTQGTAIYIMHGNRDFLLGKRFADAAGARLLSDPCVVELNGSKVLLMHGDTLCTRDTDYMAFREQARDPEWQRQILAMPVIERIALARQLREQSGEANSNKAEDIMDVTPEEVTHTLRQHGVTTLIHGHTHRPAVHEFEVDGKPAKRFVLGDWHPDKGWEIVVEAGLSTRLRDFTLS
ncbi:UDP-2,3-diacylglucosamine diphosphatase [Halomonas korlensis]|uniref:UDP-2,3-diacylglucosamine hydrolase n=1 Tax=Halomonas korlensis TaxID=463301 RepID=A0A1I7JT62_9GAMM|nr:UDP-2,3-diacylglucosamine diphosphatase [Halomonas korlensis]SFU88355.1 UDP-2,3-diacylglucosamine hydrolase [Halomonas korlensis]